MDLRTLSRILVIASVVVAGSCAPPPNDSGEIPPAVSADTDPERSVSAKFASIATSAVAAGGIEGIQFALVQDGRSLSTQAFGLADRERKITMTVDTPINVASISKSLAAWGVLAFLEQNELGLGVSVRELLDDRQLYSELFSGTDVTVRMLLSHTSGLSGASVPVTPATEPLPTLDDILLGRSTVRRPRLQQPPGSSFLYSGAGYLVLQGLLENQTGLAFAEFMSETVLDPATMTRSAFAVTPEMMNRVAIYYRADGRRREPYHLPGAAGGLYSTAGDMARYLVLYLDSGRATRERIISDAWFSELLSPVTVAVDDRGTVPNIHYALGHYVYSTPEGSRIIFHAGGNPGLRSIFVVAPGRDAGFFAVANNDNGSDVLAEMLRAWGEHYGLTLHEHF